MCQSRRNLGGCLALAKISIFAKLNGFSFLFLIFLFYLAKIKLLWITLLAESPRGMGGGGDVLISEYGYLNSSGQSDPICVMVMVLPSCKSIYYTVYNRGEPKLFALGFSKFVLFQASRKCEKKRNSASIRIVNFHQSMEFDEIFSNIFSS